MTHPNSIIFVKSITFLNMRIKIIKIIKNMQNYF